MTYRTAPRTALGFSFSVISNDAAFVAGLDDSLVDLPEAGEGVADFVVEFGSHGATFGVREPSGIVEWLGSGRDRESALDEIWWEVNRRALVSVGETIALHAAVIGSSRGLVAVCGTSGAGKSTLAAAAAVRGWAYGSDEFGVIDPAATRVRGYPRPLTLRPGALELVREDASTGRPPSPAATVGRFVPASLLGAEIVRGSPPLRAVITLTARPGDGLARGSAATTLLELCRHSATLARRGRREFAELEAIVRSVPGYLLGRLTPASMLDEITSIVAQD